MATNSSSPAQPGTGNVELDTKSSSDTALESTEGSGSLGDAVSTLSKPQENEPAESTSPSGKTPEERDKKKEEMEKMIREKQKELLQLKLADARKKVIALRQQAAASVPAKPPDSKVAGTEAAATSSSATPASTTDPGIPTDSVASATNGEAGGSHNEDLKKKRETLLGLLQKKRRLEGSTNADTPQKRLVRPRWGRGTHGWNAPKTPSVDSDEDSNVVNGDLDGAMTPSADSDAEFITGELLQVEQGFMPRPGIAFVMKNGLESNFVLPLG